MIVVIPHTDPQCNSGQEPDWEWLPAKCPACDGESMIGHGRRSKQAHAPDRDRIPVRRALCKLCEITCTILPAWSLPYTHYALETRQATVHNWMSGKPRNEAAPVLKNPDRSPDAATVSRWSERRLEAFYATWEWVRKNLLRLPLPTILAWDFRAALRILIPEAKRDELLANGP